MPWLYNLNMNESLYTYYLPNVYSACAIIYHVISKGPVKMSQSSASSCVGEQPAEGDIMERLLKSIKVTFYPQSGWCTFQCTLLHKRLSYGSQNNILKGGFFRLKWNETPNLIWVFLWRHRWLFWTINSLHLRTRFNYDSVYTSL